MITGGSTSVREGWGKLRTAGAAARAMLVGAAADAWKVDAAQIKVADGKLSGYERAGFRHDGGFRAVRDDRWIAAMWRPVGGSR